MNKEEKEAIREIKETKFMLTLKQEENFDIILNLIDKLQKENEELKEDNKKLNDLLMLSELDYVSKDRIRNKIKELEEKMGILKDKGNTEGYGIYYVQVKILEELLEE